jgi:hypothetical protein
MWVLCSPFGAVVLSPGWAWSRSYRSGHVRSRCACVCFVRFLFLLLLSVVYLSRVVLVGVKFCVRVCAGADVVRVIVVIAVVGVGVWC